jgi:two-component system, cell cycle response regulator
MQVLLVEDSPVYRKLIGDYLKDWGFTVQVAEDGSRGWQFLQAKNSPKLALLDWVLPDLDGIELCRRIRQAGGNGEYVYVILLTGKDGHRDMLKAMQAGADDYLAKPFDAHELKARLMVGQRILKLQEELIAARESMRQAATHDCLTGLMNRSAILAFLGNELERSTRRGHTTVGVMLADIDHFKDVNDSFGHLHGDDALREISARLRSKLRVYDGIGRYGGEEFLLILPACDLKDTRQRADELREYISSKPVSFGGPEKLITISMGIAISSGSGEREVERLLSCADLGLYQAKRKGRNRVESVQESAPGNRAVKKRGAGQS